ncbi:DUF1365 domain-containing protein [Lentzea sp. NBRC 105346]|uniref:DUF1365 domain-containing protein n=1 Tax=Lentzea sp. NBRC 105346 TaxID=3032205 RepID=UPI0024A509A3|nr:DUF1365 domain-containing protein [Lentzea sp. NBRC 105346]GLZ33603.1 DUF1365 domain-containing protein [Lentzea sp. NBRC 105346]
MIYDVEISHTRRERIDRSFTHRAYLWLVDLDRLPELPWWLRPFARFEARDHLGSPDRSIRANLEEWLRGRGVDLSGGQVLMLANARVLGYVFNPLTVYWCHSPQGELVCVVAEVHNTYGGRHAYLLRTDADGRAKVDKDFYVSPFLGMGGEYVMRLPKPASQLSVTIALRQNGMTPFSASMRGTAFPATPRQLVRTLLRRPLMPHRVSALIRRHGVALFLRRLPITPRSSR